MATKKRLFCATVARLWRDGTWMLMNKQATGWSSYAVPYPTLDAITDLYDVELGVEQEDECSRFVPVLPRQAPCSARVAD